jgi:hypothetical protein
MKFYLTFGVQYPSVPHPKWAGADKDGWVTIEATSDEQARELALAHFGNHWSMIYPEKYFPEEYNKRRYYPKGQLALLTAGGMSEWDPLS